MNHIQISKAQTNSTQIAKTPTKPALKWVGGKTQLLDKLQPKMPKQFGKYIDPFMGALAIPLKLNPERAVLCDANKELVITHCAIRDNVDKVIAALKKHKDNEGYFRSLRAKDWRKMPPHCVAARMIFLNKTCFNGLYKVNKKGGFSVAYGKTGVSRSVLNEDNLRAVSHALQGYEIIHQDFRETLKQAEPNDVVFLDPPYHDTFSTYTITGFSEQDQVDLATEFDRLSQLGCHVITTNSNHEFIHQLYAEHTIDVVDVRRSINCKANKRKGTEVIITPNRQVACRSIAANDDIALSECA